MEEKSPGTVRSATVDQVQLAAKIADFQRLSPADFFEKYTDDGPAFIIALPKQKAIKRVLSPVLDGLAGQIITKRINGRDSDTYAIDTETGVVFGLAEMKPGGLVNAFTMNADGDKNGPLGNAYINSDIDKAPAPVIGLIGQDTFTGLKHDHREDLANVHVMQSLNTSHAGLYLGSRQKEALEDIGSKEMTIAVTDRYESILHEYLEEKRKGSKDPDSFIMPDLVPCDGGTEDYIKRYGHIDVFCDIIDSGASTLQSGITHAQLISRSRAEVVYRSDMRENFPDRMDAADRFLQIFGHSANEYYAKTHPHLFSEESGYSPSPDQIMTTEEFLNVMELDIEKAEKHRAKKDNEAHYGAESVAEDLRLAA